MVFDGLLYAFRDVFTAGEPAVDRAISAISYSVVLSPVRPRVSLSVVPRSTISSDALEYSFSVFPTNERVAIKVPREITATT